MIARLERPLDRTVLLLCALALAALGLDVWQYTAQQRGGASWFDNVICTAAAPLQSAVRQGVNQAEATCRFFALSRQLAQQNVALTARVAELEEKLTRLQEAYSAGERERALRQAYPDWRRSARVAHVTGAGTGGWLSYLILDRGSAEGTRPRDVVLARDGVVGQVYAVTTHTARALPLTDPASGVAVRVQRSRETGVLKGMGEWQCELRYLDPEADVRPGDKVLTAGTGGVFPKGLPVGTVTSVTEDPYTPGKLARVELAARLGTTEEVLVLRASVEPGRGDNDAAPGSR